MGENILPDAELRDFLMSRKAFRKPDGLGSVSWKVTILIERQWSQRFERDDALVRDIEALFELRNALVHYKLGESAAKSHLPPPVQVATEETRHVMTVF